MDTTVAELAARVVDAEALTSRWLGPLPHDVDHRLGR
jgi:hypothetical protein